jgi:hypothetical protein
VFGRWHTCTITRDSRSNGASHIPLRHLACTCVRSHRLPKPSCSGSNFAQAIAALHGCRLTIKPHSTQLFMAGPQFVDGIQMVISDEFKDWVLVCLVSQIPLLVFRNLNEAIRSASTGQIRLSCIGGVMIVLKLS